MSSPESSPENPEMDKKANPGTEHIESGSEETSNQTDSSEDVPTDNIRSSIPAEDDSESAIADPAQESEQSEAEPVMQPEAAQAVPANNEGSEEEDFPEEDISHDDDESEAEDLSSMSTDQLVELIENFADADDLLDKRGAFNQVRSMLKDEFHEQFESDLQTYLDKGGERDDFKPVTNPLNERFHKAVKKFQKRKEDFIKNREKELQQNLAQKKDILDEMRIVAEQEENIGRAFSAVVRPVP